MNTRRNGTTSRQMVDSVKGSIYIWPEARSLDYAIRLAEYLGRTDLQIFSASDLRYQDKFNGRKIYGLTVDHACYWLDRLGEREYETLRDIESRIGA